MTYKILFCLFTVPFFMFWRRWFGGCDFGKKILNTRRWPQVVVYFLVVIPITFFLIKPALSLLFTGKALQIALWSFSIFFAVFIYVQFWSRGHGACFDEGRDQLPSEETIRRYNERWYHYVCDWIIPKKHWYGFLYDFIYMGLRYTCPCIGLYLISYIPKYFGYDMHLDHHFLLIGLMISPLYAISHTLFERDHWIFEKFNPALVGSTNLGEFLAGAIFGLFPLFLP